MKDERVRERFQTFYRRSVAEIDRLNEERGLEIPHPDRVIFGHTHQPIAWDSPDAAVLEMQNGTTVRLFNAGGWLDRVLPDGREEFCGAEVFRYDSSEGWSSRSLR